jgi:RNA polymerase sigma-70 factor, ECF subfamily
MSEPRPEPGVTAYLERWSEGDRAAFDALLPLVEAELRRVARRSLRRERADHTLQPTALVNQAWLRLEGERSMRWRDRGHFFAVAAQVMRYILVDYARRRGAGKRGGDVYRVSLSEALDVADSRVARVVHLDAALSRLERRAPRKAKVATLRLFAGACRRRDGRGARRLRRHRDARLAPRARVAPAGARTLMAPHAPPR